MGESGNWTASVAKGIACSGWCQCQGGAGADEIKRYCRIENGPARRAERITANEEARVRCGTALVEGVLLKITVLLLRDRYQLGVTREGRTHLLLCEEAVAVSATGSDLSIAA